jgi:GAF domain-containing protein
VEPRPSRLVERRPALERFVASLRELASRQEVDETLQLAVDLATELIPGCDIADIMFIRSGGSTTPVATGPLAIAIDELQERTDEGPCLTAAREQTRVLVDDLEQDDRWPRFAPLAMEMGVRSALSFQLFLLRHDGDRLGALNLYGTRPRAFDADAVALGEVFAVHSAAVLAAAIARDGAQAALESRDVIGQAKGILMARHRISAADAFDLLRRTSQARNVKLRDLADEVAESGLLTESEVS